MCFGPDAATYRTELYPRYHADRPPMPEELAVQWVQCRDFFERFGWSVLDHDSLEADDLLGSLAKVEADAGGEALLYTDRKSIRLNSSHANISYAVFCLKK